MASTRLVSLLSFAVLAAAGGCTHWGTRQVFGQPREVGRRLLGAPQVAETTTSEGSVSFGGVKGQNAFGADAVAGGASGRRGTVKRSHCIQEAQIDWVQPVEVVPTRTGRVLDWAGSVTLAFIGLGVLGATSASQDSVFQPGDPLYEEPPDPTAGYLVGGGMTIGGIGWILYSYRSLPKGPAPPPTVSQRTYTTTEFVESTGCGLVPADQGGGTAVSPAAPADGDVAARLKKLEELRASGLITEDEYQDKRRRILEGL